VIALPLLLSLVRAAAWPLALGGLAGLTAIATASSDLRQPVIVVVALLAVGLAAAPPRAAGVAVLVGGCVLLLALSSTRDGFADVADRRISVAELDDRTPEWRGALREFARSPVIGVGPERPYVSASHERSDLVRFVHSEPLQVALSAGIIGLGLLAAASVHLYRLTGRTAHGPSPAWARAALLVFALGGVTDFSWHLPALGIVGGMIAALAARRESDQ
jgi:O-antigen ligase